MKPNTNNNQRMDNYFLKIPGEIRNNIYHKLFTSNAGPEQLQYLLTCKQWYNEAGDFAFAVTDFTINFEYVYSGDHLGRTFELAMKAEELPARLTSLVNNVTINSVEKLDALALLYQRGIYPAKITINNVKNSGDLLFVEESKLANFEFPSISFFSVNPRLTEIVLNLNRLNDMSPSDHCDARSLLESIVDIFGNPIGEKLRTEHYAYLGSVYNLPCIEMDHHYEFEAIMNDGAKRRWSIVFCTTEH